MDSLLQLQAISSLFALALFYILWLSRPKNKKSNAHKPPEPSGGLPIVGHLLQLAGPDPLHRTLGSMADKYGPVFMLRFGSHRTLIVNGRDVAKECFTTNDQALSARPKSAFGDHMSYNYAMFGFATYGPYWREVRKIATSQLLSNQRLKSLMHVRATEISTCMDGLYGLWIENDQRPVKMDMKKWLYGLAFNILAKMIIGKRFFGTIDGDDEAVRVRRVMQQVSYLGGVFVPSDALPFLKWMDLQGHEWAMKRTAGEMDTIISSWLEEHRVKRQSDGPHNDQDFMDVLLSILESAHVPSYDTDTIIKATVLMIIEAGSESMSSALIWTLSVLMNNRHVLVKAQEEVDHHVGRDRHVDDSDVKNLVYLNAIIKETLRLYPPSPLGVPHEAMQDCYIGGYHIPKGTRVMVNMWRLHRDPHVWSNPHEFQPERFLTDCMDTDFRGQHFEFMPFGYGRRSCPGMPLALPTVHLTLARLIHCFEWATTDGGPVDMTETLQTTLTRSEPLELVFTPRLSPELYKH
ncbi:cytochrome P450 CYP82D47-like [Magnolia sinica]|uniref:cytochrome P450 CYP82D47-like n=1 Tax=Magnolia sinica TaxID=86752 RepID=UPI002659051E|nr:cytochrome P450 CYP82D47-like [Magnolia sinica]